MATNSTPSKGASPPARLDLSRPNDPPVTVTEKIRFFAWVASVALGQAYRDLKSWRLYRPLQAADLAIHYFFLPIGRMDPRLILGAPQNRMLVRTIPEWMTRDYEELDDLSQCPTREIINAASNNYGGFTEYEHQSARLIESTLRQLPFNPAPPELDARARKDLAEYMSAEVCVTTTSGFGANILAFRTMAEAAAASSRKCVFLMDSDCHSSMFTGAFMNKGASFYRFKHNDLGDLEYKLRVLREKVPDAFICVAVEGMYSMEGVVSPGPALLALKRIFKFCLLIDEAHAFMSMGSGGRGSFEWWQERGYDCPLGDVDVITATLSKSVGCTGGFVVANGICASHLQTQGESLPREGEESLSTVALVRTLSLLEKPLLIKHRMQQLKAKASFVSQSLSEAGCKVLSSPDSAVICFPVGTVRQASNFHAEALKQGFAVACGVPPATPLWGCRIRMCVFATSSWSDILNLVNVSIAIACKLNIHGIRPMTFDESCLPVNDEEPLNVVAESEATDTAFHQYVATLSSSNMPRRGPFSAAKHAEVVSAGVQAFNKYGVGPCSARWFYGSFDIFVALERRLARLYPSLQAHAGRCRAMICADTEVMLVSLLNACTAPVYSQDVLNMVLIPSDAPLSVQNGATMQKASQRSRVHIYDSLNGLKSVSEHLDTTRKSLHLTVYLQTTQDGTILDLGESVRAILDSFGEGRVSGLTLILDDRKGLGKIGPRSLGYLDLMESQHGQNFFRTTLGATTAKTTVLVTGSWFDSFGHQGGYVIGGASMVESLTVNAKAFLFSTPPMPVQAAISDRALELLSSNSSALAEERSAWDDSSFSSDKSQLSTDSPPSSETDIEDILLRTDNTIAILTGDIAYSAEDARSKL
ncbi:a-oxoamine synthase fum8 [Aspergillus sclerotiicarbonarius CBS 121057]|uniref:A-oxoamine synthase fum8 n=1 Tax=Aspergillus sclerotiicarbonarius (strain CBS 121057 / IBT 28362) TaxID=1448318 RepID=A0A319EWV1_ASPSB|nr:a-oxoamine synthase fum8 [Aspergillus sclerotiicarbonarius CBS 121057]